MNPLFSANERIELLRAELPLDVEVVGFQELGVDICAREGYGVILRGLRTVSDFEFGYQMALTNRHLTPAIETVFVMPGHAHSFVSSWPIKDVCATAGTSRAS